MKLQIQRPYVDVMIVRFPGLVTLQEQLRFGNKAEIPFNHLSNVELAFLRKLYEDAGAEMKGYLAETFLTTIRVNDIDEAIVSRGMDVG